ncbi:MAG: formate dehydrogenase accessory protein FdhE [Coriobacteriales bacterium]|jgi:FdhE protein|nr:formate dehydrogenase accessory protein FdhE [Coriobacteriales bacterium]
MDINTARAAIDAYRPLLADDDMARLEFFLGLWEFQQGIKTRALEAGGEPVPEGAPLAEWYWGEKPLLAMAPLELDTALFADALKGCTAQLVEGAGLDAELANALTGFDWAGLAAEANGNAQTPSEALTTGQSPAKAGSDPGAFIEALYTRLGEEGHSEPFRESVALIVTLALRPLLEPAADVLGTAMVADEQNATRLKPLLCPVCGSHAATSRVGDVPSGAKNGRLLSCSLCGMQWEFERIRCSRCGTQNQGKLHYFHAEGDDAHRLYLCDECGGYTRTTFAQNLRVSFSFEVEDVVMARLDHIAQDPRFWDSKNRSQPRA